MKTCSKTYLNVTFNKKMCSKTYLNVTCNKNLKIEPCVSKHVA